MVNLCVLSTWRDWWPRGKGASPPLSLVLLNLCQKWTSWLLMVVLFLSPVNSKDVTGFRKVRKQALAMLSTGDRVEVEWISVQSIPLVHRYHRPLVYPLCTVVNCVWPYNMEVLYLLIHKSLPYRCCCTLDGETLGFTKGAFLFLFPGNHAPDFILAS
jgi:hypothetical protein